MHLVYPPNFAKPLSSISLGATVLFKRNWKQWLCNFFKGVGDGEKTRRIMVYVNVVNKIACEQVLFICRLQVQSTIFKGMVRSTVCLPLFSSKQCIVVLLLDPVSVTSGVISLGIDYFEYSRNLIKQMFTN